MSSARNPSPGELLEDHPWSVEADQRLRASFNEGLTVAGLADEHQSSPLEIRARLIRLGRLGCRERGTIKRS